MTTESQPPDAMSPAADLRQVGSNWGFLVGLGVLLLVLALCALSFGLFFTTVVVVIYFGIVLLVGGITQIVQAFMVRRWRGFLLHLLIGVLEGVVGLVCVAHPVNAATDLTLILALFFIAGGAFRSCVAVANRFAHWPWVLLSGIIDLVLGVLILRNWPEASFWLIGLFFAIDLMFTGWTYIMLGLAARNIATTPTAP